MGNSICRCGLIDWMVFYATFNSISVISRWQLMLFMSFLGFTSTKLGSEVSCPRTFVRKNPEDQVRLEPRTPRLQVKHFTTGPRRTPVDVEEEFFLRNTASFVKSELTHYQTSNFRLFQTERVSHWRDWSALLPLSILLTCSSKKHGWAHKITQGKHKIIIFLTCYWIDMQLQVVAQNVWGVSAL